MQMSHWRVFGHRLKLLSRGANSKDNGFDCLRNYALRCEILVTEATQMSVILQLKCSNLSHAKHVFLNINKLIYILTRYLSNIKLYVYNQIYNKIYRKHNIKFSYKRD